MKKFNFLSKAALLVAPFAVAATFGAANANADTANANGTPNATESAMKDATKNDKQSPVVTIVTDGSKLETINSSDNATDKVKKAANNVAYYAKETKDQLLANNAKDANAEATANMTFNAYLSSADSSTQSLVNDESNNDATVANIAYNSDNAKPVVTKTTKVTKQDIKNDLKAVQDDMNNPKSDASALAKAVEKLTNDKKAFDAQQNATNDNEKLDIDTVISDELVDAENAAANAQNNNTPAKKPAKKAAKKHARKHARKFTVRVKAHKIYAYKSANFRRHAGRKAEKRGKKLTVYGVIKKGHKTYYRVFGHRVITANKHFVKRV